MNTARNDLLRELARLRVRPAAAEVRVDSFDHQVDRLDAALRPTMCATSHSVPAPARW